MFLNTSSPQCLRLTGSGHARKQVLNIGLRAQGKFTASRVEGKQVQKGHLSEMFHCLDRNCESLPSVSFGSSCERYPALSVVVLRWGDL